MNNQNQNSQNEQSTDPSARNEHGFFTKAKAVFAGSVLVGGAAIGLSHNQGNDTPAPTNEAVPAAQAVVPGTVLEAKPVATPEPGPAETIKPTTAETSPASSVDTSTVTTVPEAAPHEQATHKDKQTEMNTTPGIYVNSAPTSEVPAESPSAASNPTGTPDIGTPPEPAPIDIGTPPEQPSVDIGTPPQQ